MAKTFTTLVPTWVGVGLAFQDPFPAKHAPAEGDYVGFFINSDGDRWVFVGKPTAEAWVVCSDPLVDNPVPVLAPGSVNLVVRTAEAVWIKACWEQWRETLR